MDIGRRKRKSIDDPFYAYWVGKMKRILPLALIMLITLATQVAADESSRPSGEAKPTLTWKKLPGVDDKEHSLDDLKEKEVVVVVFTCNSCPYAVDYEDRIVDFAKRYCGDKSNVALVAINVNKIKADSLEEMKKRSEKKAFPFPYLFDETQKVAQDFGATYTPEFFILDKDRKVVFQGGMDDSSDASKVKKRYLEDAMKATLEGKPVAKLETGSIGCGIRFERRRRTRRRAKPKVVPQD